MGVPDTKRHVLFLSVPRVQQETQHSECSVSVLNGTEYIKEIFKEKVTQFYCPQTADIIFPHVLLPHGHSLYIGIANYDQNFQHIFS